MILADGRHLWRVFDNLMNNICKYALSGTRVYLTLAQAGTKVRVSFRNISRDPLDMPAAQLLERFARGDAAGQSYSHHGAHDSWRSPRSAIADSSPQGGEPRPPATRACRGLCYGVRHADYLMLLSLTDAPGRAVSDA